MARILIAEDETDIRNLISFTLRFAGHEVIDTVNGEQAFEKIKELAEKNQIPDLILLDVLMPGMSGYETCELIKSQDELKNIPIAFLSARGQEVEIQIGFDVGAVAYIVKPFAPEQLNTKVAELLE